MARLFGSSCCGTGAIATRSWQHGQAYFGRMCRITRTWAGLKSSCSETSSPMRTIAVPSAPQRFSSSERSWTTSTRGSVAAIFLRPPRARSCAGIVIDCVALSAARAR